MTMTLEQAKVTIRDFVRALPQRPDWWRGVGIGLEAEGSARGEYIKVNMARATDLVAANRLVSKALATVNLVEKDEFIASNVLVKYITVGDIVTQDEPEFEVRPEGKEFGVEDAYAEDISPFEENPVYKAGFAAGWAAVFKRIG